MSNRIKIFILGLSLLANIILVVMLLSNSRQQPEQEIVDAPIRPATEVFATNTSAPATSTALLVSEPTVTPQPSPTNTIVPTVTETAVPSPTSTSTPQPPPTHTPLPTDTPAPTATNTPIPLPQPDWLAYINRFRQIANLPMLKENFDYTTGSTWHSSYMVLNDAPIAHSEDPNNQYFAEIGDIAARKGNIFATTDNDARFNWAINFWFSAPFHALPLLDPRLEFVGYGDFVQATGTYQMAAVADVRSGIEELPSSISYPIFFPGDGSQTWITRHSMLEWPEPLGNCPGYEKPTGPPILLQLGTGDLTPHVNAVFFVTGDDLLPVCAYSETSYVNSNSFAQETGRAILDARDAVVIIPQDQLIVGRTYEVTVVVNEVSYVWSFDVVSPPRLD